MTREMLEKELNIAGVPNYVYNLTGHGKKMIVCAWKKLRINGLFIF